MAESDDLFAEVASLRREVEQIKHTTNAQVRFNENIKNAVFDQLSGDPLLVQLFNAVDGEKSQMEIIKSTGIKKSSVSNKLRALSELELIEPIDKNGKSVIYRRTNFAKIINLKALLKRQQVK